MKLVVADDNIEFRKHLVLHLMHTEGIEIIGEAGNVPETITLIKSSKPDMVILDLHMPGGSGFDVLHEVVSLRPRPIIIILTVGSKSEYQSLSYLAGADYFFEKSSDLKKMVRLVKRNARKREKENKVA
jgi:DNA-binding NarL/FixJ family response regulator